MPQLRNTHLAKQSHKKHIIAAGPDVSSSCLLRCSPLDKKTLHHLPRGTNLPSTESVYLLVSLPFGGSKLLYPKGPSIQYIGTSDFGDNKYIEIPVLGPVGQGFIDIYSARKQEHKQITRRGYSR